jgi:hypothetical protein
LNRLIGLWQRDLLVATVAERELSASVHVLTDDCTIERVSVFAGHGLKAPHRELAVGQEILKQTLEERPHRGGRGGAEVEHQIQFARPLCVHAEAAHLTVAHLVAGMVLPLIRAAESLRVAHQHDQRGIHVLHRAANSVGHAILHRRRVVLERPLEIDQFRKDEISAAI